MTTIPVPLAHAPQATAGTQARTTPQQLERIQLAVGIGAAVLFLVVYMAVAHLRSAIWAVGHDSAPSIIAAQHIRAKLADMDSNAANGLLDKPGANVEALKAYQDDRKEVADNLVEAAKNITFGDAEQKPIATLVENLPEYEGWVAQARTLHERNDPAALFAYRHATDLMHSTLLKAADDVDKVNDDALNSAYGSQHTASLLMLVLLFAAGVYTLIRLIGGQRFLSQRFRRTLNPPMLGATVLTILLVLYTVFRLLAAMTSLRVAKEDAFDSVRALWQARSIAFDANGEESRWLLDKSQEVKYQSAFFDDMQKLAVLPQGQTYASLADTIQSGQPPSGFKGHFATELNNITFTDEGEKEAALETLRTFGVYMDIDSKIRELENSGKHAEAVALCIGNLPGQSNYVYDQFDKALDKTLTINQTEFDQHIAGGLHDLWGYDLVAPVIALGIAGLTLLGLRPRLQEYEG